MRGSTLCLLLVAATAIACDREASECRSRFADAQRVVQEVKSESADSVRAALSALDGAISTCDQAKLGREREELKKARSQLRGHLELLERRSARKKKDKPTPEQLEALVKQGDPSCPKGQAYRNATVSKEIRCTGPQIIDMSLDALRDYYSERRYKVSTSDGPVTLKAEYGAELYVFTFESQQAKAPRCVVVYPPPGPTWQEIVARVSGADPEKLKPGKPIDSAHGELPVRVESGENKLIVRLGNCG